MDILLKHENYNFLKRNEDNSVEEAIDAEFSLPEYMPEIMRIIKTTATPKVLSSNIIGNRITVDGVCEMRMVYVSNDNCIYSFTVSKPFTRHLENDSFDNAVDVKSSVAVSFVDCRATGTKRAEVKAGVVIKVIVYTDSEEDIISLDNSCSIQEKNKTISAISLGCKKTKSFSLSDTLSLDIPSSFVVSSKGFAVLSEMRKINNKVMIKGEAVVDLCYVNASDKASCECVRHILPINQILEFPGMEERFEGNLELDITALDVSSKGELGGVSSAFDISVGIDASVNMWEEKEVILITDAYSTECNINLKSAEYVFYSDLEKVNDTFVFDGSFSVQGEGVSCVVDKGGYVDSLSYKAEEGCINVSGIICTSFIIKDNAESLSCITKNFDFSYQLKNDCYNNCSVFEGCAKVLSLKCGIKGENTIEMKAEINVYGASVSENKIQTVTDITVSDKPFSKRKNAITVYFPDERYESLWGIARRYNTTVKAIAEENDLEGDTTEEKTIVFIP